MTARGHQTIKIASPDVQYYPNDLRNKYEESSQCLEAIWADAEQIELRLREEKLKKEAEQKRLEEQQKQMHRKYFRD